MQVLLKDVHCHRVLLKSEPLWLLGAWLSTDCAAYAWQCGGAAEPCLDPPSLLISVSSLHQRLGKG